MPFQGDKFEQANLTPRTARVPVPGLAPWFDEGEEAVWVVRNLTSAELFRAMEAAKTQGRVDNIVRAIVEHGDQVAAIRRAIGLSKDTPGEIAKRLEMLVAGSVEPRITLPQAVKLAEAFPIEFMQLSSEIVNLTGKGADVLKPEAASQTTTA